MLNKITLAILSIVISGFVFAGTMGPSCIPVNVTVPCVCNKWDIAAQAIYFQPTYSAGKDLETDLEGNLRTARLKWGWGYRLQGSYHFCTGNDLSMTLIHYDKTSKSGHFAEFTPYATTRIPFNLSLANKFDQVNLILGQHVDMGTNQKMRFYGGIQYAKILVDTKNHFTTVPIALTEIGITSLDKTHNTQFEGVGPVLGIDVSYHLLPCLSLTGNTAFAIPYGTSRFVEDFVLGPDNLVNFSNAHKKKVVTPSMEAKLGVKYIWECVHGILHLEGGYQVINYFNLFQTKGQIESTMGKPKSDFGLYGPYFGAKWVGNI
jgi:Legionella pneumophila major outer membrane protein precursor